MCFIVIYHSRRQGESEEDRTSPGGGPRPQTGSMYNRVLSTESLQPQGLWCRTDELRGPGSVKLLPSKGSRLAVGNDVYIKRLVNVKSLAGY